MAKYGAVSGDYRCKVCGQVFSKKFCLGVLCDYKFPPERTGEALLPELQRILSGLDECGKIELRAFHDCMKNSELSLLSVLEGKPAGLAELTKIRVCPVEEEGGATG